MTPVDSEEWPLTLIWKFSKIAQYDLSIYENYLSPVAIFGNFLSILRRPMSPVKFKKSRCSPVVFKGQGPRQILTQALSEHNY